MKNMFENIKVIKRDGKKVDFDGSKIALAIKKGFDSVNQEEEIPKYSEQDINKVYNLVIEEIKKRTIFYEQYKRKNKNIFRGAA